MNRSFAQILLLLVVAYGGLTLNAQSDIASKIDQLVQETYVDDMPGASIIVVKDGQPLYRGAKGLANVELGVPLETDMVFRLGSITKQFTAASILLLQEQGKLSIADSIDQYLPYFPADLGATISIEQLLTHTSGIVSYTGIPGYMMSNEIRKELSTRELVAVFKDLEPDSAPGEKWLYNNSGYVLLGAIIEEVSQRSYEKFVQENIFDPLGMVNSYYGSHTRIIPRRADGYQVIGENLTNARFLSMSQPHAAGSLLSTVDDLAIWDQALFSGKVLSEKSFQLMTTSGVLNNGETHGYGFGLMVQRLDDRLVLAHGGGIFGFATAAMHVVDANLFVAVFSNGPSSDRNPSRLARQIVDLVLASE